MELFRKAKVVRFKSHHDKYLLADDDQEGVCQDRDGTVKNARWTVEIVPNAKALRFRSCYDKYLTASNMPFRLGLRGKKVLQTLPKRLDSSLEWEPVREGYQVRLKTPYGQFLRANGGVPPWRNSVTHDVPHRSARQDWVLWAVDVIEIRIETPEPPPVDQTLPPPEGKPADQPNSPDYAAQPPPPPPEETEPEESTSPSKYELILPRSSKQLSGELSEHGSPMNRGRTIYYNVANEKGEIEDSSEEFSFLFKGSDVEGLKLKLKEETALEEISVCCRNPLNGQLYTLRLHLPPNNHDMHIVVVPQFPE